MNEAEAITEAYDKGRKLGRQEAADEIERLRAALRELGWGEAVLVTSLPPTSQWQPIETAPKDGTFILLVFAGSVYAGYWGLCSSVWPREACKEYPWATWGTEEDNALMDGKHGPTHWQPLPPPPGE